MVSAQITGMSANAYGQTGSVKTKSKDTAMDFGAMMSHTLSNSHTKLVGNQDFSKVQTSVKTDSGSGAGRQETGNGSVQADKAKDLQENEELSVKDKAQENVQTDGSVATDDSAVTDQTEVSKAAKEAIDETFSRITDKLKKQFGLSDEELEELLAQLGMTVADLTDTSNLTKFVAAVMGEENSLAVITNEAFMNHVYELSDFINGQMETLSKELNVPVEQATFLAVKEYTGVKEEAVAQGSTAEEVPAAGRNDLADKIEIVQVKTGDAQENSGHSDNPGSGEHSSDKSAAGRTADAAATVAGQLTHSIEQTFTQIIGNEIVTVDGADIVRQIIDAVKVIGGNDFSAMEIALNPEHLGKLNLTVIAKEGAVTAQIVAENETVKRAIESQLSVLKTNFEQQGIRVEAIEVTVASHSFDANAGLAKGNSDGQNNSQSKRRGLRPGSLEELSDEETSPEEERRRQLLGGTSSVEFTA